MHNIFTRVSNVSGFLSSCLMVLLGAIALSSFTFTAEPTGDLAITSVKVFPAKAERYPSHSRDFAFVRFNMSADFTPLFHWNTKQLFLYLSVEYTNAKGVKNDVVIWDRIVRRKQDAVVSVVGKNKYSLKDFSSTTFKNVSAAHYSLKYNLMPYVGALTYGEAGRSSAPIQFPESQDRVS